jgi:aldose 1-epimerase
VAFAPSGEQYEIASGDQRATIVEVGGGIREYSVGSRPVLDPYPIDAMCDGAHGAPLIPWPNRLGDGRYRFEGRDLQVALTEPGTHNAIHGFLRWRLWQPVEHVADRVVMSTRLLPLTGYPFGLDVSIAYALTADGLVVTTTATNIGDDACPYASGHHPYLSAGGGLVDDCLLEFAAATRILTDEERQLPSGDEPVRGTPFDFHESRRVGDLAIDFAFTDVDRDAQGRAWVRLTRPEGDRVEAWTDDAYPFLEIYSGDTLSKERRRRALGVEPMTCAPNGFQSGRGLLRLEPGASTTSAWGARLR